ncbi:DNA cytosine methyltransferase [Lachnospiraceae bacterium OttesenSCG-928-J05]|nr:DNA cytosine methyltransferase [Lachnospiraceae bacterium OttesenSCG-928-J05]
MYRSIDLFAGIGGIRRGFDNAFKKDIETVFVSEWDKHAQATYSANYKDSFKISGDITNIDEGKDVPEFDICLAGFPCQAFSLAGKRMGFDDDYKGMCRGSLFQDVVRICEYHNPKVIFCENVKGLLIHDKGRTFKVIKKAFEQIGYDVYYKVLNSKDFGVPQNRERIYIVAFRKDIDSSMFEFPVGYNSDTKIKDIMEEQPVSVKYYLSTTYIETLRRHKDRHKAKGNGFGYEIRDINGQAGAIVCGGMGRERNLIIDHRLTDFTPVTHIRGEVNREGIRKMTPREWARLQGFPDDFKLPLADTHLYKQLGNSVTVNTIEAIAKEIQGVLNYDREEQGRMERAICTA